MAGPMFFPLFHGAYFTSSGKDSHIAILLPGQTYYLHCSADQQPPAFVLPQGMTHTWHHQENSLQISEIQMGPDGQGCVCV